MKLKKVAPGLYEREGTPRNVRITPEFESALIRNIDSDAVRDIVREAVRRQNAQYDETEAARVLSGSARTD